MKLYYMAVGLTFVLSFQGSRSQQKPPRSLSSKKEHPVPEEGRLILFILNLQSNVDVYCSLLCKYVVIN